MMLDTNPKIKLFAGTYTFRRIALWWNCFLGSNLGGGFNDDGGVATGNALASRFDSVMCGSLPDVPAHQGSERAKDAWRVSWRGRARAAQDTFQVFSGLEKILIREFF
jgi:hypothetical protein